MLHWDRFLTLIIIRLLFEKLEDQDGCERDQQFVEKL
jgi:hypothetical protein